jgi:hypothetical protein
MGTRPLELLDDVSEILIIGHITHGRSVVEPIRSWVVAFADDFLIEGFRTKT